MKKVFLDTNIILDFTQERDGADFAEAILQMGVNGQVEVCTSFLSMANVAYIARKGRTTEQLYKIMGELIAFIRTLPMDESQLQEAITHSAVDFEDMLQYQCALACACDAIVTRNAKHFLYSSIPVFTPKEFIENV